MTAESQHWSDLVAEMYALVREQAPLHEVTSQVTDVLGEGREIVHGPWQPSECQMVLLPWHRAGWIELIADADPPLAFPDAAWRGRATREGCYLVLSDDDARNLLHDPARWLASTADGNVMLSCSDRGSRHEYPEWLAAAEEARGGKP